MNIQPALYWSSTDYASDPDGAWGFNFSTGDQPATLKSYTNAYAWAVRDGDVSSVPEPTSLALLGLGLAGLGFAYKKKSV